MITVDRTMITVDRIQNRELVIQALMHPLVWPNSSDDFSSSPEEIEKRIDIDSHIYVGCWLPTNEYAGCYLFYPHNTVLWECHTMLLPRAWGPSAIECAEEAKKWLWSNTLAQRLITNVPEINILALRYARKCGFVEFGFNPNSIQKNGKLIGQYMLGINHPSISNGE